MLNIILLIFIISILLLANTRSGYTNYNGVGAQNDHILNFIVYPNQQKFCPNIYNSLSSFWTMLPKQFSNGLYCKFCCTSCYYFISEEIVCGNNSQGIYKICKLTNNDIVNLENYNRKNSKLPFQRSKISKFLNSNVLKIKKDNVYYPIQILKTLKELNNHEDSPTINNKLYRDSYDCN